MSEFQFPQHDDVFQIHVSLIDTDPAIWRRILVDKNVLLPRLHKILQVAMGWQECHLHQFSVGDVLFGPPDREDEVGTIDYRKISLCQIARHRGSFCTYEYDFGDSWQHRIGIEDELRVTSVHKPVPYCLGGERACPPEDSGGIGGYEQLLEALRDPSHEEHDSFVQWAGRDYDPRAFNAAAVNKLLARLRARRSVGRATAGVPFRRPPS